MDCGTFRENHGALIDRSVSDVDLVAMQRHLEECSACAAHDTTVRRALLLFRNMPAIEPSADFSVRLHERLRDVRAESGTAGRIAGARSRASYRGPGVGVFAGLAAGVVAAGYLFVVAPTWSPAVGPLAMAPVVAAAPALDPAADQATVMANAVANAVANTAATDAASSLADAGRAVWRRCDDGIGVSGIHPACAGWQPRVAGECPRGSRPRAFRAGAAQADEPGPIARRRRSAGRSRIGSRSVPNGSPEREAAVHATRIGCRPARSAATNTARARTGSSASSTPNVRRRPVPGSRMALGHHRAHGRRVAWQRRLVRAAVVLVCAAILVLVVHATRHWRRTAHPIPEFSL